jgi:hypothetical protein
LTAGAAAAAATVGARSYLQKNPPGGEERWMRTNHRGEPISLMEGPEVAAGVAAGALVGSLAGSHGVRPALAATVATAGAAYFGEMDDLHEDTSVRTKGIKGHVGALMHGELTTGGMKILGIGGSAMAAAAIGTPGGKGGKRWMVDTAVNGALIAATANLLNLLDLRPGRALKSTAILTALPAAGPLATAGTGAVVGAGAAAWSDDLGERTMLGDAGANALGALAGTRLALGWPLPLRAAALAGTVALTVISEKVSFSQVIADTPWLRAVDDFGRRAA